MPHEVGDPRIRLTQSELKSLRIAYCEESKERGCFDSNLSEMMIRTAAKATNRDTIVEMSTEDPRDMLEVIRVLRLYVEYKEGNRAESLYEKYLSIYEKAERQLISQGLMIR